MKKTVIIMVLLLVGILFVFADEYTVASYSYLNPTYWTDETMKIRYEDETNEYMFYVSSSYSTLWMIFTEDDLKSIRETVDKALEWEKIAIENKAKVSKEIPDSSLKMQIAEKSGSSFYIGSYKVPVTFSFVSTEDAGLTTLMIIGGTTTASSNKYIDLEFQSQVITDISSFAEAISEKAISSAIAKHNDDLNVADDLFK